MECLSVAKGFYKRANKPPLRDRNGRMQGGLPPAGNTVADGFKQLTVGFGLNLGAAQIRGQRMETLAYRTLAVIIEAMALGTISQVYSLTPVYD